MNIVEEARQFSINRHGKQLYGIYPYSMHLDMVASLAHAFCRIPAMEDIEPDKMEAAAWLHDILEDTNTTLLEIDAKFGEEIGDLVYAVTDEFGVNRKERKAKTLKKTRGFGKNAVFLKLMDRIVNVNFSRYENNVGLLNMYRSEAEDFHSALYDSKHGLDTIWELLKTFYET